MKLAEYTYFPIETDMTEDGLCKAIEEIKTGKDFHIFQLDPAINDGLVLFSQRIKDGCAVKDHQYYSMFRVAQDLSAKITMEQTSCFIYGLDNLPSLSFTHDNMNMIYRVPFGPYSYSAELSYVKDITGRFILRLAIHPRDKYGKPDTSYEIVPEFSGQSYIVPVREIFLNNTGVGVFMPHEVESGKTFHVLKIDDTSDRYILLTKHYTDGFIMDNEEMVPIDDILGERLFKRGLNIKDLNKVLICGYDNDFKLSNGIHLQVKLSISSIAGHFAKLYLKFNLLESIPRI